MKMGESGSITGTARPTIIQTNKTTATDVAEKGGKK